MTLLSPIDAYALADSLVDYCPIQEVENYAEQSVDHFHIPVRNELTTIPKTCTAFFVARNYSVGSLLEIIIP